LNYANEIFSLGRELEEMMHHLPDLPQQFRVGVVDVLPKSIAHRILGPALQVLEEGRAVFDNLVKFIDWTLPTNIGEGLVILVPVFAGLTLPITSVQILWINMTTAVLLGLMLVFEGQEPGIMERPPRRPETPVLTWKLGFRICLVSLMLLIGAFGLFEWVLLHRKSVETARTVAVNMFVFGELFYLYNCRSLQYSMFTLGVFSNRWLILGVVIMALLQILFTYSPVMNQLFGTAPMETSEWALVLTSGLAIYSVVGTEKWLRRRAGGEKGN